LIVCFSTGRERRFELGPTIPATLLARADEVIE